MNGMKIINGKMVKLLIILHFKNKCKQNVVSNFARHEEHLMPKTNAVKECKTAI